MTEISSNRFTLTSGCTLDGKTADIVFVDAMVTMIGWDLYSDVSQGPASAHVGYRICGSVGTNAAHHHRRHMA